MRLLFVAIRSGVVACAFVWLWVWVAGLLRPLDDRLGGALPPWSAALAVPILCAGAILAGWCVAVFALRGGGTPAPFDPPRRFVASGPYRRVRNPMYLGGALLLLGFGLAERSPAIVAFVPAWLALFHLMVVAYEEPVLRSTFGAEYAEYCRSTPRWVPRLASTGGYQRRP